MASRQTDAPDGPDPRREARRAERRLQIRRRRLLAAGVIVAAVVAVVVAVVAGGAILFPSLGLLFSLLLRGRLGEAEVTAGEAGGVPGRPAPRSTPLQARVAVALLIVGIGFLNGADAGWAHVIGVFALFGFMIIGFAAIVPRALAQDT